MRWHAGIASCAVFLVVGCTGTPMPIPPSFHPDGLVITETEPTGECQPTCVQFQSGTGTTENASFVTVHRRRWADPSAFPYVVSAPVAGDGSFTVSLGGTAPGPYRIVLYGPEGVTSVDVDSDLQGQPPYPVREVSPRDGPGGCLTVSPDVIDFGTVELGSTSAAVVELTNGCAEEVTLAGAEVAESPPDATGMNGSFGVAMRYLALPAGGTTSTVVAYWPTSATMHQAVLLLQLQDPTFAEIVFASVPLRGQAE